MRSGESVASLFGALSEGLRDLGYVEGRNVIFERRYADGHMDRLPEIAAELVQLKVDVIVTGSSIHVAAARQATKIDTNRHGLHGGPRGSGLRQKLGAARWQRHGLER